jgi:hypothetical protein
MPSLLSGSVQLDSLLWFSTARSLHLLASMNPGGTSMDLLKGGRRRHNRPFTTGVVVLLALIAFVHLFRLLLGWEVTVNGMVVPKWVSGPGLVITAGLALMPGAKLEGNQKGGVEVCWPLQSSVSGEE